MAYDPTFSDLMPDTITVHAPGARDAYGRRSPAAAGVSVRCRVSAADRLTRTTQIRGMTPAGTVVTAGPFPEATVDHVLHLPDGTTPPILSVNHASDEDGPHHTVIVFGPIGGAGA